METAEHVKRHLLRLFEERGVHMLFFGGPKTGKTSLAVGFALGAGGKVLIIDYEGRIDETLALAEAVLNVSTKDRLTVMRNPTCLEVETALADASSWGKQDTVIFDGLTSWSEKEMHSILAVSVALKLANLPSGAPGRDANYLRVIRQTNILLACEVLTCNVVVIAHEEFVREREDVQKGDQKEKLDLGAVMRVPSVCGRSEGLNMSRHFDFVFYTRMAGAMHNPIFEAVTQSAGEIRCGGTAHVFDPVERLDSIKVKGKERTYTLPAFNGYKLFKDRLAQFTEDVTAGLGKKE